LVASAFALCSAARSLVFAFAEGFAPPWFAERPEEDKTKYIALLEKYGSFGWFVQHLAVHPQIANTI
jgi:hypothetical protein